MYVKVSVVMFIVRFVSVNWFLIRPQHVVGINM